MAVSNEVWRPGSFTKNFSWGENQGLKHLYDSIRVGFNDRLEPVTRNDFRARVANKGRPDYIPLNFFLFSKSESNADIVIVDELVFQAVSAKHSARFDKLALFAFNLSYAGQFRNIQASQSRPALWANHYIRDVVAGKRNWDTSQVSADDIEQFVKSDPRYQATGARKLATNLNYLYKVGGLSDVGGQRVERWWVDALFLALDRIIADRQLRKLNSPDEKRTDYLEEAGFQALTGQDSLEKQFALKHLVRLYNSCGGARRF